MAHKQDKHHGQKKGSEPSTSGDYYFDSYAHISIHEEMIKDTVRTNTYRTAIMENAAYFQGKAVLDVGCGTGILSCFCAQAGARVVYAVEASDIADYAKKIVEMNNLQDKVQVIKGRMENVILPEKVDIIISEWMGYFLIYESMLDSVIAARDKWLNPGGMVFPNKARIYMAPICDDETWSERVDFWHNVYGLNMTPLRDFAIKCAFEEPMVEIVPANMQLAREVLVKEIDINTATVADIPFSANFAFNAHNMGYLHGFFSWFDCDFEGPVRRVTLSTSPNAGYTHWRHTIFYFDEPILVQANTVIRGSVAARPNAENPRFIDVDVNYSVGEGQTLNKQYSMK